MAPPRAHGCSPETWVTAVTELWFPKARAMTATRCSLPLCSRSSLGLSPAAPTGLHNEGPRPGWEAEMGDSYSPAQSTLENFSSLAFFKKFISCWRNFILQLEGPGSLKLCSPSLAQKGRGRRPLAAARPHARSQAAPFHSRFLWRTLCLSQGGRTHHGSPAVSLQGWMSDFKGCS